MEHDHDDGRDEDDLGQEAAPALQTKSPDEDPERLAALSTGHVKLRTVNKAMILAGHADEAVPGCAILLGTVVGTSNQYGNASLDLSGLPDGIHRLRVMPPNSSTEEVGPHFSIPDGVTHLWSPFEADVRKTGNSLEPVSEDQAIDFIAGQMRIGIRPLWIQARAQTSNGMDGVDMVTIHHTAGTSSRSDLNALAYGAGVSAHYLVPPNGETIKLVKERDRAWHAGWSHWQGREALNKHSIGIEITHLSGEYPEEQIVAVEELVERIVRDIPGLPVQNVVAHSDIALNDPARRPPKTLNRKSGDPSSRFPWERLENRGWGLVPNLQPLPEGYLGGYFDHRPDGALKRGDRDSTQTFGGEHVPEVTDAVAKLQGKLRDVGYYVGTIDGDFGGVTHWAVRLFQQHIFSGSRQRGSDPENSGDGLCDLQTAEMLGAVSPGIGSTVA